MMSDSKVDPERIAALLDGRLNSKDREDVLAEIRSSESGFDDLVEASALIQDVSARRERRANHWLRGAVYGIRPPRRMRWILVATTVGGVAAASITLLVERRGAPLDVADYPALLTSPTAGLPDHWDSQPWRVSRGASGALTIGARSARVGALLVDLELAVRTGDTTASALALQLSDLIGDLPASAPTIGVFAQMRRDLTKRDSLTVLLNTGRISAIGLVDPNMAELGGWTETARIAATRHDSAFFSAEATGAMLSGAANANDLAPQTKNAFRQLGSALAGDSSGQWSAVAATATYALRLLAQ